MTKKTKVPGQLTPKQLDRIEGMASREVVRQLVKRFPGQLGECLAGGYFNLCCRAVGVPPDAYPLTVQLGAIDCLTAENGAEFRRLQAKRAEVVSKLAALNERTI